MAPPRKIIKNSKEQWLVDLRSLGGGREFYQVQADAERAWRSAQNDSEKFGKLAWQMSHKERTRYLAMEAKLAEQGTTLEEVIAYWQRTHHPNFPKPIQEAVDECLAAKTAAGRRKRTVQQLRYALNALTTHLTAAGVETVTEITGPHLEQWLADSGWQIRTRKTRFIDAQTFLSFCVKRGWLAMNPAATLERIEPEVKAPGILTVPQVRALMDTCRKQFPGMVPFFAIGIFAGVRPSEIITLSRERIINSHIVIGSLESKTRQRRLVEIKPNLRAWLELDGGKLPPVNWQREWGYVRKAAGFAVRGKRKGWAWRHDCMRHSFCSYALPIHGAAWTALQAGHSEQILFQHYRELVPESAAREFWSIVP